MVDKPTMEEIQKALDFIDEWGNGGPGSVITAAYRAKCEKVEAEINIAVGKALIRNGNFEARVKMLERQYGELVEHFKAKTDWYECCQTIHDRHAAEREGR